MTEHESALQAEPPEERGRASSSGRTSAAESYTSPTEGKTRRELEVAKESAEMIVNTVRESLLVLDLELQVKSANRSFYAKFLTSREETEGKRVYELGNGQWNIPELRKLLEEILPESKSFDDFEVENDFKDIGQRVMLLNARRLDQLDMIPDAIVHVLNGEEYMSKGLPKD